MKTSIVIRKKLFLVFLLVINGIHGHTQELKGNQTSALLDRLARSRQDRIVQANFREKKVMPMMREPIIETGKIAYEQPDKLMREVEGGSLTVSDGETLWMYYPQFQQAEKYSLSEDKGPGKFFSALTKVFQLQNLNKYFRVEALRLPNGFRLELSPRTATLRRMLQHVSIELDEDLQLRSSIIIGTEGDRIETKYSHEKLLPPGSINFSFNPPQGVQVVSPLGP